MNRRMHQPFFKSAQIPKELKTAKVTPVYKDGKKSKYTNYRAISVLPTISKILERCVYSQLMHHLESKNLLSTQQFGFRKRRSTETAALLFTDEIHRAMDQGNLTGALFIDLSKAFDTVSHSSILAKLPEYGISGIEKSWFTDYIFDRQMKVNYLGTLSTSLPIYCGVPQCSILGPLLFLLHFNEMPSLLKYCKMIMYADDTVLFYNHKDQQEIEKVLSKEFGILSSWLRENELILNLKEGKTEIMMFGTKKRLNQQERQINVKYRSQPINTTQSYKYPGVQLDPPLNMKEHFKGVCKKVSTRLRLLKRIRPFITDLAMFRIYQALIVPSITYCSLTNFYHQPYRKSTILLFESRVGKLTDKDIPSIDKILQKKIYKAVFKCLKGNMPMLENYFERVSHNKETRNNNIMLRVPKIKLESTKRAFFYKRGLQYSLIGVKNRN